MSYKDQDGYKPNDHKAFVIRTRRRKDEEKQKQVAIEVEPEEEEVVDKK